MIYFALLAGLWAATVYTLLRFMGYGKDRTGTD